MQDYYGSCDNPLPNRCLDDSYIIWDISHLPCGEYQIVVEAYAPEIFLLMQSDLFQFCSPPSLDSKSSELLDLSKVKKSDLVRIASIYEGDGYLSPGSYRPHNNHRDGDTDETDENTVDCCGYVTQLLRRLARFDFNSQIEPDNSPITGTYPIDHSGASYWNYYRTEEVIHLEDNQ